MLYYINHADIEGNDIVLTAKYSLVNSVQQLPVDISQIHCHSVVHVRMLLSISVYGIYFKECHSLSWHYINFPFWKL